MSGNSIIKVACLALAVFFIEPTFAADDATMHQVYQAAEAGKFSEAQSMMDKVLRDHPNSAKAHYVEAELLAKQGQFGNAEAELKTAEHLQPGLPFAKAQAVESLKARISAAHRTENSNFSRPATTSNGGNGMPWGLLFLGIGLIVFIIIVARWMTRRNTTVIPANNYSGYGPGANMQPAGGAPMMGQGQPMGMGAGGMGSGILGSLATGAAIGAGVVAGEALMHHFTDGERSNNVVSEPPVDNSWNTSNDDMGGTDFGIADNSSWDDGSSGGGDDWT